MIVAGAIPAAAWRHDAPLRPAPAPAAGPLAYVGNKLRTAHLPLALNRMQQALGGISFHALDVQDLLNVADTVYGLAKLVIFLVLVNLGHYRL